MSCRCINTGMAGIPLLQTGATITLPPGSTDADLQAAINGAGSGDIIIISGDMDFTLAITVPIGLAVTIQSSEGNNWIMTQAAPGFRHFDVLGSLILYNVTLEGSTPMNPGGITRGGVQVLPGGAFYMGAATAIRNCYAGSGGGVHVSGGSMEMEDGFITGNRAGAGGGVYVTDGGTLNISGGFISGNESTYGGGVYLTLGSLGMMTGGVVGGSIASEANTASTYGGGVSVYQGSRFVLDGGFIEGNRAVSISGGNGGGGAYVIDNSVFELRSGAIRNNFTGAGASYPSFGGGIMMGELTYVVPPGLAPASTLYMSGGAIEGNEAEYRGGGVAAVANCNIYMSGGMIKGNTAITNTNGGGGGVFIGTVLEPTGITFRMDGGEVAENTGLMGGGVLILGSQSNPAYFARLMMNGGEIINNESTLLNGGGVCALNLGSEVILNNPMDEFTAPLIIGNRSSTDGGGVYTGGTCVLNGASIASNTALNGNGGGVYVRAAGSLSVSGASLIKGNDAPNGNGGGIFTEDFDYADPANTAAYANITTAADTVFADNTALAAYYPPSNAGSFTNIGYTETSIHYAGGYVHPLNNYDINYEGFVELVLYRVVYMANGGTGGYIDTNIAGGSAYMLLSAEEAGVSRSGYTFTGWNTEPDGTGIQYSAGDVITITDDLILYAQWEAGESPGVEPPDCMPPECCIPCIKPCCEPSPCFKPCCRPRHCRRYVKY